MGTNKYVEKFKQANANGQIWRANGKDCLIEVIMPDYEAGFTNVTMTFLTYSRQQDGKGKKTGEIRMYFTVSEFLAFCERINRGDIQRAVIEDKSRCLRGEVRYYGEQPQNGIIRFSGMRMSPEMKRDANGLYSLAMLRGKENISRQFFMSAADATRNDNDIVLTAVQGPGETTPQGITMPKKGVKPDITIRIPMPFATLEEMAASAKMRLYALDAQNAISGTYKRVAYERSDIIEDVPENVPEAEEPASVVQPTQPVQPTQTAQTNQPVQAAASAPVTITVKFTSAFQAVQNWWVVQVECAGQVGTVYFQNVPESCKKAQEIGSEVTFNVIVVNGMMVFHSLI